MQSSGEEHRVLNIGFEDDTPFFVDANVVATGRTCVIGASGSGKSYAVAVVCEELCKQKVPFAIVDTEGEYAGIKDRYEAILVSEDGDADLMWSGLDLDELARQAPDIAPLLLDTSELDDPKGTVQKVLEKLYQVLSSRRTPYLVIIEEADRFVPQSGVRVPVIGEIARRGRKRGIGLMVCTQRPSLVDKNILSQCGNQIIGKLVIQNDLLSVSQFFSSKGVPKQLTSLKAGNFYVMGGLSDHPSLVKIRKRETSHGGFTPELKDRVVRPFMGTLGAQQDAPHQAAAAALKTEVRVEAEGERGRLGFPVIVPEEEIPLHVSKRKSHVIFGEEEKVTSLSLNWRPLTLVTLLQRKGLLRKVSRVYYLLLDSATGSQVKVNSGLEFEDGFQDLLGLDQKEVRVLRALHMDKTTTVIDVQREVGYPRPTVRRLLAGLGNKGLVSSTDMGGHKEYRSLVEIPAIRLLDEKPKAQRVEPASGTIVTGRLEEDQVREVVKALWNLTDAVEFVELLYPVWRVQLELRGQNRIVWIDGRTAREVGMPRASKMP